MHSHFGRYLILKKIAVGGMAEIFLARRVSLGGFSKFVVIKRLAPEYQGKRSFEQLFFNEARLTARLSHPNIVQVNDIGQNDGAYFMVMEYIHGVTSAEMMSQAAQLKRPVPLGVALGVALSTARALEYCGQAHNFEGEALKILHHDVSPHNIQVRYDGEVKLLDFGVATQQSEDSSASRRGKFAYMSPEAYHRQPLDARSDMFSLGVVLYELTMGRRLFKGRTQEETRQRAEECVIPRPREIHARFPEPLEALLLKALSKDRDERFADFTALRAEIERVARHLKLDVSPERVARYLGELYAEEIKARAEQLKGLAARAELMREEGLDELAVIRSREESPTSLEDLERERDEALEVASHEGKAAEEALPSHEELFVKEGLDGELASLLNQEGAPNASAPLSDPLPAQFTEVAQRERDWDESEASAASTSPSSPSSPSNSSSPSSSSSSARHAPALARRPSVLITALIISLIASGAFVGGQLLGQGATPWAPWASPRPVTFEVKSTPSNIKVLLNGLPVGVTPLTFERDVSASSVELQLTDARFKDLKRIVEVTPGQKVSLELSLEAR